MSEEPRQPKLRPVSEENEFKVDIIDYTGHYHSDPAYFAANMLLFAKSTRLGLDRGTMCKIWDLQDDDREAELKKVAETIPAAWEFVNYTFLVRNCTRAFTHQLVRTREASYAQETMRVLDKSGFDFLTGPGFWPDGADDIVERRFEHARDAYAGVMGQIDAMYNYLVDIGVPIEDARGILPTNIKTNILVNMNLRRIVELCIKRTSSRVQGEYRGFIEQLMQEVQRVHPWTKLFFRRVNSELMKELDELLEDQTDGPESKLKIQKIIDQLRRQG